MINNMQDLLNQSIRPLDIHKYKDNRKVTINNDSAEERKSSEEFKPLCPESENSMQYPEQTEEYGLIEE